MGLTRMKDYGDDYIDSMAGVPQTTTDLLQRVE
jgi:hypothetical protein